MAGDLRFRRRQAPAGRLLLFVVDASGSMAGRRRIAYAKGAVEALLLDAYRRRDHVALIAFRGAGADLLLPPTNSVDLARRRLHALAASGRTPLAAALHLAHRVLTRERDRRAAALPALVLLSDGRANVPLAGGDPWADALRAADRVRQLDVPAVVVDAGSAGFDFGLTAALGQALAAPCFRMPPASLLSPAERWS
jgi:magnesium chelatase subunit D